MQSTRPNDEEDDQDYEATSYAESEQRKAESRELIESEIKRELAASEALRRNKKTKAILSTTSAFAAMLTPIPVDSEAAINLVPEVIDDSDREEEKEVEYEKWRQRELARLMRDYKARTAFDVNKEEVENRRFKMTREERRREEQEMHQKEKEAAAKKPRIKFLQKYYHKGAFYHEDAGEIVRRDFNQPTLEDHFEVKEMPKVMQRKNFGKSGQTKWTHLTAEDTSSKEAGWYSDKRLLKQKTERLAGTRDLDAPYQKRRKRE